MSRNTDNNTMTISSEIDVAAARNNTILCLIVNYSVSNVSNRIYLANEMNWMAYGGLRGRRGADRNV